MYLAGLRSPGRGIDIWDYQSKRPVVTLRPECEQGYNSKYCISSDGYLLAVSTARFMNVHVYDISNLGDCRELYVLEKPGIIFYANSVSFSKYNDRIIAAYNHKVVTYDASNGQLLRVADGHHGAVLFAQLVGITALSASEQGELILWGPDLEEIRRHNFEEQICQVCVAPSEEMIAVSIAGRGVAILNLANLQHIMICGTLYYWNLQFNLDGSRLLASGCDDDPNARVYDVGSGAVLLQLGTDHAMCYSLDGTCIYSSVRDLGTIRCWDSATGTAMAATFLDFDSDERDEWVEDKLHEQLRLVVPVVILM
jgi:WD40 repeat protein